MSNENRAIRGGRMEYLDVLRFLLALATMTWHYYYFGPRSGVIASAALNVPGIRYFSFSVEIFFIISGFVIVASAVNRKPLEFLVGRAIRLGPCLLICATITLVLGMGTRFGAQLSSVAASVLIVPLTWMYGADASYWSLRYEIFFYALVFGMLCVCRFERHIFRLALAIIAYDAIMIALSWLPVSSDIRHALSYPVEQYAPFFAIGILLYLVLLRKEVNLKIAAALAMAVLCAAFRCYTEADRISQSISDGPVSALQAVAILAVVLGIFLIFAANRRGTGVPRVSALLGKASYPLYLVHQNLGYRVIDWVAERHLTAWDIRPFVMAGIATLAIVIAAWLEPVVAAGYRRVLRLLFKESVRSARPPVPAVQAMSERSS
ncbi:acyltransferase family protein [Paraburkholderia phosphatilytica]|uniref:acyltransferase family protein n=1 Tax=Paraburkholderia phosphatilytica TaxID=2282883 RepID=UPI000E4A2BAE|nr:acyltransferase [Paraburkholderia phosphatilytica]